MDIAKPVFVSSLVLDIYLGEELFDHALTFQELQNIIPNGWILCVPSASYEGPNLSTILTTPVIFVVAFLMSVI